MLSRSALVLPFAFSCGLVSSACADVVSDWNEKTVAFVTNAKMAPPQAERVMHNAPGLSVGAFATRKGAQLASADGFAIHVCLGRFSDARICCTSMASHTFCRELDAHR